MRSGLAPQEPREDAEGAEKKGDPTMWSGRMERAEKRAPKKKIGRTDRLYSRVQTFITLIVVPGGQTVDNAALAYLGGKGSNTSSPWNLWTTRERKGVSSSAIADPSLWFEPQ